MIIVFSGVDCAGKSTQIELLKKEFLGQGIESQSLWSRGGYTPGFELLKKLLRIVIGKKVKIQNNVKIFSFSHLENVKIENNVRVGPYARLRPGTFLKSGSRVGNFVEVKKSTIGKESKVNHLSYIGDSQLGRAVNIGAGTITCNYDGVKKSKTNIKDKVFIGSNSSLIAPVTINENSIVGAGSVITKNVKKKSLALTRSSQVEIKNYKRKK